MPVSEVTPAGSDRGRARKGRLTWLAILGMPVFIALLLAAALRPVIARHDGPEAGAPRVVQNPPP